MPPSPASRPGSPAPNRPHSSAIPHRPRTGGAWQADLRAILRRLSWQERQRFSGEYVGKVTPIDAIGTDRGRLDSYTAQLAQNQGMLYSADPERRFRHFRKTWGYANAPLDGLWLRAPYLHNGSVPTLWDLLQPPAQRPKVFWRGNDLYDPRHLGFVAAKPKHGKPLFATTPRIPGNGNAGHAGAAYGTTLPDADKWALLEYLKTF
jgi:hypothetical protein